MKNLINKFSFSFFLIMISTLIACNSTVDGFKFPEYNIDNSQYDTKEELKKDEGMVIDGILDEEEWQIAEANKFTLTHKTYPDVTLSSMCYLGKEGVYFGVVVNDTHIYYNEERVPTRNSSVEIQVKGFGNLDTRAYSMIVGPTGNGNEVHVKEATRRLNLNSLGNMQWMFTPFKWEGAATVKGNINTSTNEGYVIETFMPWSEIGVNNHKYIRTYVAMNHVEGESSDAGRSWSGDDGNNRPNTWRIASNEGLLEYEDIIDDLVSADEYMSIDGSLDEEEWENVRSANFIYTTKNNSKVGLSTKSYMTEKGAYFGFVVKDDDIYYADTSVRPIGLNSGMEILFAPYGSTEITSKCLQLRITANNVAVGYTGSTTSSYPWVVNPFEMLSATTIQGELNTSGNGNEGFTIELFIPWTSFGSNSKLDGVMVCPSVTHIENAKQTEKVTPWDYCNVTNAKVDKQTNPSETFIYMEEDGAVLRQMKMPSLFLTDDMLVGDYYLGDFDIPASFVNLSNTASCELQYVEPEFITPENVEIVNNNDKSFTIKIHKSYINDFKLGVDYLGICNGNEHSAKIYYSEVNTDGIVDDSGYGKNVYVSKTNNSSDNKVVQIVSTTFGERGFFIGYEVFDSIVKNNTRVETYFTIGDEIALGKTFQIRAYVLSGTYRSYVYQTPLDDGWAWNELTGTNLLDVLVKTNLTDYGYMVELFIPYETFGLNEAPEYFYMLPVTSYYKTQTASSTSQYHKDNGISNQETWDINLYSKFNQDGYVSNAIEAPIVEYTFNNGEIVNTGTQTNVNSSTTKDHIEFVNGDLNEENGAINLNNDLNYNQFSITNIEGIGTGDFTLRVKFKITKPTSKTSYENYLFGIGDKKDVDAPYFNLSYTSNKGNMQIRLRVNGENVWLQYIPVDDWVEIYLVRCGNVLTLYIDPMLKFGSTNYYANYYYPIELNGDEAINFTEDCVLGFASNEGCQNPGDYPLYIDDIKLYDYAFEPYSKGETNKA